LLEQLRCLPDRPVRVETPQPAVDDQQLLEVTQQLQQQLQEQQQQQQQQHPDHQNFHPARTASPQRSSSPHQRPPVFSSGLDFNLVLAATVCGGGGPSADERLARLYERNMGWRKRREERFDVVRREREGASLDGCTFAPCISPASRTMFNDLVRYSGRPKASPRQAAVASAATAKPASSRRRRSSASSSALARSAARAASAPRLTTSRAGASAARRRSTSVGTAPQSARASAEQRAAAQQGHADASAFTDRASARSATGARGARGPVTLGHRLYDQAAVYRSRMEAIRVARIQAEKVAREWLAPKSAREVAPRVYQPVQRAGAGTATANQRSVNVSAVHTQQQPSDGYNSLHHTRTMGTTGRSSRRPASGTSPAQPSGAGGITAEIQRELGRLERVRQEHRHLAGPPPPAAAAAAAAAAPRNGTDAAASSATAIKPQEQPQPQVQPQVQAQVQAQLKQHQQARVGAQPRLGESWRWFIERQQSFLEDRAGKILRDMGRQRQEEAAAPGVSGWEMLCIVNNQLYELAGV